jgi:hypothetical protein
MLPGLRRYGSAACPHSLEEWKPGGVTPYLSDFGKEFVAKAAHECLSDLVVRAQGRRPAALFADPDRPTPTFTTSPPGRIPARPVHR